MTIEDPPPPIHATWRLLALAYGIVAHGLFLLGVSAMVVSLYTGVTLGLGSLHGGAALAANAALVLQFPLVHSWLLSRRGRAWLHRLAPAPLGPALASTSFAAVSSLQLLILFLLWSPSGIVWWRPHGAGLALLTCLYAGAWVFLQKALWDAGLALQSGFLGWGSLVRGRWPRWDGFPTRGLFRACRQPVYLGFALTLWTGPVWTPDRLALAIPFTAYCVAGPLLKERRYLARHGEAFRAYQSRVPYMLPVGGSRRGSLAEARATATDA